MENWRGTGFLAIREGWMVGDNLLGSLKTHFLMRTKRLATKGGVCEGDAITTAIFQRPRPGFTYIRALYHSSRRIEKRDPPSDLIHPS